MNYKSVVSGIVDSCMKPDTATLIPTLGERLLISRRRADISASAMASRLRVSPNTIVQWERDRTEPGYLHLERWAAECGIDPSELDADFRSKCFDHAEVSA